MMKIIFALTCALSSSLLWASDRDTSVEKDLQQAQIVLQYSSIPLGKLQSTEGLYEAKVFQRSPDGEVFVGFGSTGLEAAARAFGQCVHSYCSFAADRAVNAYRLRIANLTDEEVLDEVTALGELDRVPVEIRAVPSELKKFLLNQKSSGAKCSAPLLIYNTCILMEHVVIRDSK